MFVQLTEGYPLAAILITVVIAFCGSWIAKKIHLPIPYLLGAMIAVAAYNILVGQALLFSQTKFFTQALSGIFIGLSLTKSDLKNMKDLILPAIILVGCFLVFTASMGTIMNKVFGLDPATALLICVPGGVVDISLMAYDMDADPAVVSFVQSFRVFFVYLIFPSLITFVQGKIGRSEEGRDPLMHVEEEGKETVLDRIIPDHALAKHVVTLCAGLLGAYLGKISGIPAGGLSGSMVMVILLNMTSKRAQFNRKYKRYVQIVAGALIGTSITMDTVLGLPSVIVPTIILMTGYIVFNFLISWLMVKTKKIDFISAMFSSSPGGASDFALVAEELGGQSPKIAVLQIVRLMSVFLIFPTLVKIMIGVLS